MRLRRRRVFGFAPKLLPQHKLFQASGQNWEFYFAGKIEPLLHESKLFPHGAAAAAASVRLPTLNSVQIGQTTKGTN
jgi:hypothetical protein